jgi:putative adenylate-forming enzyme
MTRESLAVLVHYLRARYGRAFRTRAQLEAWQRRRFAHFARTVLARSPYYRPFVGLPLAAYPLASKAVMMDAFDRMNTRGLRRDDLVALALRAEATRDFRPLHGEIAAGLSSGTSGARGLFATSARERQRYAGTVLAKGLRQGLRARTRVALLLRANNPLYETVNASARVRFAFFDLLAPFARTLRALEAYGPDVLIGPPQALRLVADAVAAGGARVAPRQVVAGAEVLERGDAAVIEAAFGFRLDQIYQATEGFLGITCAHGTLHLNEDGIIVERRSIDVASRRFMPVITDLNRSTQPIVRYELDDVLIECDEPCPCGSVLTALARIEGRADDILFLPRRQGGALEPLMPDFVRDRLALAGAAVSDYRVIQHGPGDVELLVAGADAERARATARTALYAACDAADVRRPAVRFGGPIALDPGRKLRRVERRFALPANEDACAS